ncbi:MAG: peptidylprolyl isomerase [Desulfobacteraceae bacterium]|nr:MAG: peptidylprolyl isomerase [Desulfobacteraceae bacterium]
MKSRTVCRLILPVLIGAYFALTSVLFAEDKKAGPGDVAIVNGKRITVIELDQGVESKMQLLARRGQIPDQTQIADLRKTVLEELINIELLSQESRKKGIKVEESVVGDRLKALKSSFTDEKAYADALSKDKMTESDLKTRIEKGLLIQELVSQEVVQKVTVSPEESKAFYKDNPDAFKQPEQVHASHILIKVEPKAGDAEKKKARKEIEDILKRLKKGEDFAALAKQHSACPSKEKGGDLGFMRRGQTVKPFEDAAFALKPGETSGIVETEFGYHIVRVLEKKQERVVPYEEAQESLDKHLKDVKVQNEVSRYIEGLRTNAKVERPIADTAK